MQDYKAIIELVVSLNSSGNLVPAFSIDAAAVKQLVEFQNTVSDLPTIGACGSAQALHSFAGTFSVYDNLERLGI